MSKLKEVVEEITRAHENAGDGDVSSGISVDSDDTQIEDIESVDLGKTIVQPPKVLKTMEDIPAILLKLSPIVTFDKQNQALSTKDLTNGSIDNDTAIPISPRHHCSLVFQTGDSIKPILIDMQPSPAKLIQIGRDEDAHSRAMKANAELGYVNRGHDRSAPSTRWAGIAPITSQGSLRNDPECEMFGLEQGLPPLSWDSSAQNFSESEVLCERSGSLPPLVPIPPQHPLRNASE
jgi:hypothetical protein